MTTPNTDTDQLPEIGTPEYDEMMIAKGKQGFRDEPTDEAPKRPEHVPEKFWNSETGEVDIEGLAKSYTHLEQKQSGKKEEPEGEPEKKQEEPQNGEPEKEAEAAPEEKKVVEDAGLDWDAVEQTYTETGTLTEEQFAAIEKVVPRSIVDTHLEALKEAAAYRQHTTAEYVGGKDRLDYILDKASKELNPDEMDQYNTILATKDWRIAMDALKTRFIGEAGRVPQTGNLFEGLSGSSTATAGAFRNRAELTKAINLRDAHGERIYDSDPTYRTQVEARHRAAKEQGLF